MSIASNLFTGVAGLKSHSDAMSIISDNIANVNTIGFKRSRGNFADILGASIAGSRSGIGSMIGSVQTSFDQGALLGTGNNTDLAIRGDGFFIVNGTVDGVRGNYYTRNGAFTIDSAGYVVDGNDLRMQGYPVDGNGDEMNTITDLQVDFNSMPPSATGSIEMIANLDAEQVADPGTPFDSNNPDATSDFATSISVVDSLGSSHQLEIYFKKTGVAPNQEWDYHVLTGSSEIFPNPGGAFTELGNGTLEFNADGSLMDYDTRTITVDWAGAEQASIALDFGTPTADGGTGIDGISTYAIESSTTFLSQDGFTSGELAGLTFNNDGTMLGQFTNGEQRTLGRVALAKFPNPTSLERSGSGLYGASRDSGVPVIGNPTTGGRGSLAAGNLESSNVNLAEEFVNMISVQRGFQGNSRSITTADEMMNEILTLKR